MFTIRSYKLIGFRLTPKQLIQMIFYANTANKFLYKFPVYDIEQEVCSYYNDFSIKELSIVALCFFKAQKPIRYQGLIKQMYTSVINDITNIHNKELTSFLKVLYQFIIVKILNQYILCNNSSFDYLNIL